MTNIRKVISGFLALTSVVSMVLLPVKADAVQTLSKTEPTVFGNSSFTWNHMEQETSNNAADGTYTWFNGGGATITATKNFYVEETGEFSFEVYGASSITHSVLSDLQFNIDTDSAVTLTSANSTVEDLANPCFTEGQWVVKNIKYNTKLLLDAGSHTITFTVPQNSNNQSAAYFIFDCARFIPPEQNQMITDTNNVLEFEKFYPSYKVISSGASGGAVVDILQYNATEHNIQMVFDAEKSGNYKFVMDASVEQGVSSPQFHLSPVYICVNGGNEIEISNNKQNNFSITADASYQGSWESSRITLAENIALTEGENTINIRVAARQAGDMVVGTFDCIKLVRVKNIERITAQAGTGLIKRGESVSVIMKNQDGETVTASDFSQITYTITNADIAQVDNGILKAKNYGNTKIKIDAVTNGQTLQSEFDVNVVSEKGIWINSLEKTSTGIKVNISATEDYSGGDHLLVGVYEQKESVVTSLKSVGTAVITAMGENTEEGFEIPLSNVQNGDVIRVFLLDNNNQKRSIYTKVTYGGVAE